MNAIRFFQQKGFPWFFTVPLLLMAYGLGVYFRGTDNILFMPTIAALMGMSLFALLPGLKKGWAVPVSPVFISVMLFWAYLTASILWSTVPYNSVFFALIIGVLPFLFLVFVLAPAPVKWLKIHGAALGVAALVLSGWALTQFFFFYEEYGPRIHHPMLNPNNLAVLFNMTLFPLLALFFYVQKKSHVALVFVFLMMVYGGLLVTQSRGAFLAFVISLLPFLWVCRKSPQMNWSRFAIMLAGFVAFFVLVNLINSGALFKSITHLRQGLEMASAVDRIELWKSTWQIIQEHFWLGTGLGTFFYYYPAYRSRIDKSDGFFVHMDPLQFWQEMGVMAPVLFYAVLIFVLYFTIRTIHNVPKDSVMRLWIMAPFCGLLALVGHTHITFHLYILIVMIPAGFLLAWWYIATEQVHPVRRIAVKIGTRPAKLVAVIFIIVLYAFVASWLGRAAYATQLLNDANRLMGSGRMNAGYEKVIKADKYAPDSYWRPYEYHAKYRLSLLLDQGRRLDKETRRGIYVQAINYATQAMERNPATTHLWSLKAMVLFAGREFKPENLNEAADLLAKTIETNPMLLDARLGLARIYKSQGEFRKALEVLEGGLGRFVPKTRTSVIFFVEIAKLRLQLGDKAGHDIMMKGAIDFARRYNLAVPGG